MKSREPYDGLRLVLLLLVVLFGLVLTATFLTPQIQPAYPVV